MLRGFANVRVVTAVSRDAEDTGPSLWWLALTCAFCAVMGVIPLEHGLDLIGMPGAIRVAFRWQMLMVPLWLIVARPIARRWSLADREVGALAGLVALSVLATVTHAMLVMFVLRPTTKFPRALAGVEIGLGMLPATVLTVCMISLVGSWTSAKRQRKRAADREAMLAASVVRAELETLRTRLQPHFLLNALNTVVGLARRNDGERAADVAVDLGELLRFSLVESSDDVAFDAEHEMVERYLAIEQARLGDRLVVRWQIDPSVRTTRLPALLWQPLVENAIRHGIARRTEPGQLTLSATREGPLLRLVIDADGPSASSSAPTSGEMGGLGVGLSTVLRRLQLLHGERASLTLTMRDGGSRTDLIMPLDTTS